MYHYLATSRAQKEKQEPNGVLAHQAALAFPFVCGASRKPRKAEWPFEVPGDRGQNPKKNLPGAPAPQAALTFLLYAAPAANRGRPNGLSRCPATGAKTPKKTCQGRLRPRQHLLFFCMRRQPQIEEGRMAFQGARRPEPKTQNKPAFFHLHTNLRQY